MLKISDVAKRLCISQACAYALVESKELGHYRIGLGRGTIRVSEEQLQDFLERHEQVTEITPRRKDFAFLPPPS